MTERKDEETHGPGGMDGIDDEPIRAPDDEDAPGGMTGIPDEDVDDRRERGGRSSD